MYKRQIEVGKGADGSECNCVTRIVEPDDSDYIRVMYLDGITTAGTGISDEFDPLALNQISAN